MEKMREEFEAWKANDIGAPVSVIVSRRELDGYLYDRLNMEWIAWQAGWQASRAAQRVELPDSERSVDCSDVLYRSDVEEALDAAGIRYT